MSSSPTDGQGSALNSSQTPSGNLRYSHGSPRDDRGYLGSHTGGAGPRSIGSAQIASSEAATVPDSSEFGVGASVVEYFDDLPQKVSELGMLDEIDRSHGVQSGGSLLSYSRSTVDQSRNGGDAFDGFRNSPIQSTARRNQVVNANHLLNFHFDPISRPQPRKPPTKKQQKIRPYNKDLFLQANYKFFVLDTGDYLQGSMDPDKMLEWEDVVCVRYLTPFDIQCPICMETPMSPQITSCGHIYCFPCILQYLLMGEDNHHIESWKRCPLCFTLISPKDLYTVHIHNVKSHKVGDQVHLTLLTRARDSSVPLQKSNQMFNSTPSGIDDLWDSFTKFTLTSDVELSVRESKKDLNYWMARADSGLVDDLEKLPYVCAALDQLDKRMKNWAEHRVFSNSPTSSSPSPSGRTRLSSSPAIKVNPNQKGGESNAEADVVEHSESPDKANERDSYFFYQSVDGQHVILHPLNMKCLLHYYKSYESFPERIDGKILELETVTQSEATRRRYRFLSHLPLTTNFQLCEISLSEILPLDALSPFMDEIKKREKQRKKVAKKEEEKVFAETSEWVVNPVASSNDRSRSFCLDDFEALGSSMALSTSPGASGEKKSFSDVARLGFAAAHDSPSLRPGGSGESPMNPGMEASTTTGRRMAAMSFAGIAAAPKVVAAAESPAPSKKGKKQARVLLSTAGGRRY